MPVLSSIGYTLTKLFRKHDLDETSLSFYTSNDVSLKRAEEKKVLGRHKQEISLKTC